MLAGAGLEHQQLVDLATPMLKGRYTSTVTAASSREHALLLWSSGVQRQPACPLCAAVICCCWSCMTIPSVHCIVCHACVLSTTVVASAGLQVITLCPALLCCAVLCPADLPAGPAQYPMEPPSRYQGASVLLPGQAPAANIILAFEYGGGWRDIQVGDEGALALPR